ncbi:hypothetical protein F4780DRAFT_767198 [Xylariomycetidae sp. FL0641]|nr:hypothetical protein F4780DRAFT_767198 [Xylariomycetidae sp. FL0641]
MIIPLHVIMSLSHPAHLLLPFLASLVTAAVPKNTEERHHERRFDAGCYQQPPGQSSEIKKNGCSSNSSGGRGRTGMQSQVPDTLENNGDLGGKERDRLLQTRIIRYNSGLHRCLLVSDELPAGLLENISYVRVCVRASDCE